MPPSNNKWDSDTTDEEELNERREHEKYINKMRSRRHFYRHKKNKKSKVKVLDYWILSQKASIKRGKSILKKMQAKRLKMVADRGVSSASDDDEFNRSEESRESREKPEENEFNAQVADKPKEEVRRLRSTGRVRAEPETREPDESDLENDSICDSDYTDQGSDDDSTSEEEGSDDSSEEDLTTKRTKVRTKISQMKTKRNVKVISKTSSHSQYSHSKTSSYSKYSHSKKRQSTTTTEALPSAKKSRTTETLKRKKKTVLAKLRRINVVEASSTDTNALSSPSSSDEDTYDEF